MEQQGFRGSKFAPRRRLRFFIVLSSALLAGCGKEQRPVEVPLLSPQEAARDAMAQLDANKDGVLDAKELDRCPAFKKAWKRFDRNQDGKLSVEEIEERFTLYKDSRIGLFETIVKVTLDGTPLAGAMVTLEPESFLGPAIKAASGTTDERGAARMQMTGEDRPGCHFGLYRVRISLKDGAGKELLASKYNELSTLGMEVAPDLRGSGDSVFQLKAR